MDQGGDIYIWTSSSNWTNSTNWTGAGLTASTLWAVAISSDGSKAVAVGEDEAFYVWNKNENNGQWTIPLNAPQTTVPDADWYSVACSQDCSKIVVAEGDSGYIQTFTEGEAGWVKRTAAGQHDWYWVDSSTDGSRLVAVAYDGKIQFRERLPS